jgi:predicted nucleic acid-binding protein
LILIGEIKLLPALYDLVLIPPSVHEELGRARAPEVVRFWIARPPVWLEVRKPSRSDPHLTHLDAGERDAILLAEELHADQLIIDENPGRQEAQRRHLPFTGTLGILQAGAKHGLLDLKTAIGRLKQTSFHVSQDILDQVIKSQD